MKYLKDTSTYEQQFQELEELLEKYDITITILAGKFCISFVDKSFVLIDIESMDGTTRIPRCHDGDVLVPQSEEVIHAI